MQFQLRLKFARTCLKRQVCMKHACMMSKSIDILRSRHPHAFEVVSRAARDRPSPRLRMPSRRERRRSGAAPTATRCRAVLSYGLRPHGSYGRHRGRHRRVVYEAGGPKRSIFAPRGAFGRGDAMITGGQNRDPMPSGTLTPFPHAMRGRPDHRSASAVPILRRGRGFKRVRVYPKTPHE